MITFHNGRVKLVLDHTQVLSDDPGAGTPAMVYVRVGNTLHSGTYSCVVSEGETVDGCSLTPHELVWLDGLAEHVEQILYGHNRE